MNPSFMPMKKVILSMLCALILLPAAPVWAQQAGDDGVEYVYEEVEFRPHLFLEAGVGAQYTLGEARFKDQLSPNAQIALGYQLTSWLGGRLQVNGWQSRGGWNGYGNPSLTQAYKYKYVAPGIDVMLNLSNLILGWNPDRLFTLSVFAGGGANIAFDNQEVIAIARGLYDKTAYRLEYLWDGTRVLPYGRAGLQAAFRLSDRLSLSVEGNANILSDKYNSKRADNPDWYFNALVGVRVNLGPTYTSTALAPPAEVVEPVPMVQVERVEEPAPEPRPQQPQQQTIEPLRRDVFFLINRYDIRPGGAAEGARDCRVPAPLSQDARHRDGLRRCRHGQRPDQRPPGRPACRRRAPRAARPLQHRGRAHLLRLQGCPHPALRGEQPQPRRHLRRGITCPLDSVFRTKIFKNPTKISSAIKICARFLKIFVPFSFGTQVSHLSHRK